MNTQRGLTIIEILLVFALLSILAGIGLVMGMEVYRGNAFRSDRSLLISMLERARSESLNGMCLGDTCTDAKPHGVSIQSDRYVIFQGLNYASRDSDEDTIIPASSLVAHSGLSEVVFSVLSATTTSGQITLIDQGAHQSIITIGSLGQISWSN